MLKNKFLKSLGIILATLITGCSTIDNFIAPESENIKTFNENKYSLDKNILMGSECNYPLNITFEADESLFNYIAWVNFVADVSPEEQKLSKHPEHIILLEHLDKIKKENPEMYQRHRKAYDTFLPTSSLYAKNGLLISSSKYFGKAPEFKFYPPTSKNKSFEDFQRQKYLSEQLPSSDIFKEFYTKAKINSIWQKILPEYQKEIAKYENNVRTVLKDELCFTNTQQQYPVIFKISKIGYFGIAGQTRFSDWENKFIIQINIDQEDKDFLNMMDIIQRLEHSDTNSVIHFLIKR